ncbi:MAG: hypothetical protein H8E38_03235 [SAR324 cluster bacterium]|nr:hypothetical protein [SAR324 cluster bacterium]MBL7035095.1 hypothetical protein [SAR324 cluster bacterium]
MDETSIQLWYWGSSLVLAVLLFFPVEKMLWVKRVRSTERRLKRETSLEERDEERRKARSIAGIIVISFSFLFNYTFF